MSRNSRAGHAPDVRRLGEQMYELAAELYPICRSITGDGFRHSLDIIRGHIPIVTHEVPTGTRVFDWIVPKEWNISDAWIKDDRGVKIVDFKNCNLHIVNYSIPVQARITLSELKKHLHYLPESPDLIPYRTSYYKETWGFCLTYNQAQSLRASQYDVYIDSSLEDGHLVYGEYCLEGETEEEVLISCHACHPSLANDNLSGMAVVTFLAKHISKLPRRYTYRFLFIPGTIGSLVWLARNEDRLARIKHGLVVACVGDRGHLTYKKSRRGDAAIDRAASRVLRESGRPYEILDFSPYGYDERQYCSPGINLPVGRLTRTPHGRYPEYHTSADNLDFIQPTFLYDSFATLSAVLDLLENSVYYTNVQPKGEPQLGRRGLYRALGGFSDSNESEQAMLWILNLSDGDHSLADIAEQSSLDIDLITQTANVLRQHGLLRSS